MLTRFVSNYIQRHRNRTNQFLHLIGVPLTFGGLVYFLIQEKWLLALACFIGGYALQFLGHAIEGNDAGEVVLIKKWLGKPYVEFAPGAKDSKTDV